MDDVLWARIEAKREQNRRFLQLEADAVASQTNYRAPKPKKATVAKVKPKKPPKPKGRRPDPESRADRAALREQVAELAAARRRALRALTRGLRARERAVDKAAAREARAELRLHISAVRSAGAAAQKAFRRRRKLYREPRPVGRPSTMPSHCQGCERPLRKRLETLADRPGTVRYAGSGLCASCREGKTEVQKHDGTTRCSRCDVVLRPVSSTAAERPGTRVAAGRDSEGNFWCGTCYNRHVNNRQPMSRGPKTRHCISCGVYMISRAEGPRPGARRHAHHGLCSTCNARQYRQAKKATAQATM